MADTEDTDVTDTVDMDQDHSDHIIIITDPHHLHHHHIMEDHSKCSRDTINNIINIVFLSRIYSPNSLLFWRRSVCL